LQNRISTRFFIVLGLDEDEAMLGIRRAFLP